MTTAHAVELKVLAANAVKDPPIEVIAAFEKSSGHKVTAFFGGTGRVAMRIGGGEVVDIALLGSITSTG